MHLNEKFQLRDQDVMPTGEVLKQVLGNSYAAYETFCTDFPGDIQHNHHRASR